MLCTCVQGKLASFLRRLIFFTLVFGTAGAASSAVESTSCGMPALSLGCARLPLAFIFLLAAAGSFLLGGSGPNAALG